VLKKTRCFKILKTHSR